MITLGNLLTRLSALPAYRYILAAVFMFGITHIALLPPFEGNDETAHWSSIALWGHEKRIPIYGKDRLDNAVTDYDGPLSYGQDSKRQYDNYDPTHQLGPHKSAPPPKFENGGGLNWQAQHPPLYYLLLQPAFLSANHTSWATQFFVLRFVSWIFAFTGLVIGIEASRTLFTEHREKASIIMTGWPFLIPQFFPEMARIGNDSLCLLFFGIAWWAMLAIEKKQSPLKWSLILALALSAGLWTKAFFVPISVGVLVYFIWRYWQEHQTYWLKYGSIAIGLTLLLGIGWYVYKLSIYGNAIGGDEMLQFDKDGGVLINFLSNVTITQWIRGMLVILASFVYVGSWSLTYTNAIFLLGPFALLTWTYMRWFARLPKDASLTTLPIFVTVPILMGLCYHLMLRIALDGIGTGTPGWYLHILAPALAFALARGWAPHGAMICLAIYSVLFGLYGWIMQLALFSGCTTKNLLTNQAEFVAERSCLINGEQLSALTFPKIGMMFFLCTIICALFAGISYSGRNQRNKKLMYTDDHFY